MNRSSLLAIAAVAALAFPAAAFADDDSALNAFEKLCGATGADYPAVVSAAKADGWLATTESSDDDDIPGVSVTDKVALAKGDGAAAVRLRATRGLKHTVKSGDITVTTCTVRTDGAPAGLLDRVKAWLSMAPMSSDTDKASYLFTFDGKTRSFLATGDIEGAMNKGGAHLVKIRQDGGSEVLDYNRFSQ
jgi:hypothetical protein